MNCGADTGNAWIKRKRGLVCPVEGRGQSTGVQEWSEEACLGQGHVETEARAEGRLLGPTAGLWAHSGDGSGWSLMVMGETAGGMSRSVAETDARDLSGQERT